MNINNVDHFIGIASLALSNRENITTDLINDWVEDYPTFQSLGYNLNQEEKRYAKEN